MKGGRERGEGRTEGGREGGMEREGDGRRGGREEGRRRDMDGSLSQDGNQNRLGGTMFVPVRDLVIIGLRIVVDV